MNLSKIISDDQMTISVMLKAVHTDLIECEGCFFSDGMGCHRMACTDTEREDGKNIVWVVA